MTNTILVITRDQEEFLKILEQRNLPNAQIFAPTAMEEIEKIVPIANIFLGDPPMARRHVNTAKNLVWMQSTFAGIDLLVDPDLRTDYTLTIVKYTYGVAMAEYVLAYILMFEKELLDHITWQAEQLWNQKASSELQSSVLGIMGTGSIGQDIAKRAAVFGMKIIGYRTKNEAVDHFDEIFTQESVEEFLSQSDYVVAVLPNTSATKHLCDKKFFSQMKSQAVFMNIGRGAAVNEQDLIDALKEKRIKAAVLDVFEEEPLPTGHLFWSMPNVYITPHVSGYTVTDRIFDIFEENYRRFVAGEELQYLVNFERGY